MIIVAVMIKVIVVIEIAWFVDHLCVNKINRKL